MIKDLLVAVFCGVAVGGGYFAGLWWTVRRIRTSRRPGLLVFSSFLVRAGLTVSALYLILGVCWERLLFSLLGFLLVRCLCVRRWCPVSPVFPINKKEVPM
jgi:F1F0 ATPase subunit 2